MIPRFAALSSAEMSARWSAAFPLPMLRFASERRLLLTLRLRAVRRGVWRARLAADLEFAMGQKILGAQARGHVPGCQGAVNAFSAGVELFWWGLTLVLMAIGLLGTVLPILPGTVIILAAAVLHRVMLGPEKGLGWASLLLLALLALASYAVDFIGGWFGARRFGATKWGTFGALAGAVVGLFFGLPGLLIGPVLGALGGELVGGKKMMDAGRAGWGALLGNLAAIIGKLLIGLIMVSWFLLAAPTPF
jgi:hypothetical protein